jgi:ribosomal protein S18 acetylase RimI-like enzyme
MTASARRIIRPAREDDLVRLIEIARRSWLSAFAQTAPFALIEWWVRTDRTTILYREHWRAMSVLEDDGVIIGLVQPAAAEINGLWVHPGWHGRGAGTMLLSAGEQMVARAGHAVAWLTCSGFNGAALEFYRRRGYVETAREREPHACGVEVENVRMERRLS